MRTNERFDGIVTFGVDCDGVLRSLLEGMVTLYNESFGESMTREEVRDFDVEVSFPKIKEVTGGTASEWFFQKNGYRLFACSPALPKVKEAIDKLRSYGQVIIVTYQKTFKNKIDTLMWLNEHGIEYDGICFLKNKTLLHLDWMIDDNDWNLVGCNAENAVLITAPYNKDIDIHELKDKTNCDYIYRFESLERFADWYESEA